MCIYESVQKYIKCIHKKNASFRSRLEKVKWGCGHIGEEEWTMMKGLVLKHCILEEYYCSHQER